MVNNNQEREIRYVLCSYEGFEYRIPIELFRAMKIMKSFEGKKMVRINDGASVYQTGKTTFRSMAKLAGAIYKVNSMVLVNPRTLIDYYLSVDCENNPLKSTQGDIKQSISVGEFLQILEKLPSDYEIFFESQDRAGICGINRLDVKHEYGELRLIHETETADSESFSYI